MNFNSLPLKSFRVLLFPLALVYAIVVIIRNFLYDHRIIRSDQFNLPIIGVGNLAVGGTGKSPMVEYLVNCLMKDFKLATLSRGYKRKTRGYVLAGASTTALEIGDEPMQFHLKFPKIAVAAGEQRAEAIPQLLYDRPDTQVIILDDAFQHRAVRAGFNIVLTDYSNLFTRDFFLPTGDLRDQRMSYKRADIIVITKCSAGMQEREKNNLVSEIKPLPHQKVFFSTIQYGQPYHIINKQAFALHKDMEVLLACGIANPEPLKLWLNQTVESYEVITYSDHYIFTIDDLKDMLKRFSKIDAAEKIILTTEKDAVRLVKFEQELKTIPLFVLPIETVFLFNEGRQFDAVVSGFIKHFKANET